MTRILSRLRPWRRGEALKAGKLSEPVQTLNRLIGTQPIGQPRRGPGMQGLAGRAARFSLVSVDQDHLVCNLVGDIGDPPTAYHVAKAPLLRRSVTSHAGVSYSYSSNTARTATSGSDSEDQEVIPAWAAGDEIVAVAIPGGTGVSAAPDWLDLNLDARAWAEVPSE